jgi:UDP-N-acetylmuramate dehydrogenase
MFLEKNVPLQPYNTFGIAAKAQALVRVRSEADLLAVLADPLATLPRQVLGGGSNIVLTGDVKALVLKIEVPGMRLAGETDKHWIR